MLRIPVGVFGHSQGGWVVVEAGSRGVPLAFVVSSSGPGVTPAEQERYSLLMSLTRAGVEHAEIDRALKHLDEVVELARSRVPFEEVHKRIPESSWPSAYDSDQPGLWDFLVDICDYDPAPALKRIQAPVLALFGAGDTIVPVDESVAIFRKAVQPDLLTVTVFPGADHRVQVGDPPRLADGYLETLSSFVTAASATRLHR